MEGQAVKSHWKAAVDLLSTERVCALGYKKSTALGILDLMSELHPRLLFKTILIPSLTLQWSKLCVCG